MRGRRLLFVLLLGLVHACSREPRAPDVILISVDTLRADSLEARDAAERLPVLTGWMGEAVRYSSAVSSASWTLPAHASLFTGLYPDRHGATDRRATLSTAVETLAGALTARGYETTALTGGGFLDPKYGLRHGFERYEAYAPTAQTRAEPIDGLLARLRSYLEGRRDARPLFLFLHTYAVHNYYDARPEAVARTPGAEGLTRERDIGCLLGRSKGSPEEWAALRALYRTEQEVVDAALGEMIAALRAAGLWDGAYTVLVSDHGEGFDPERGRMHHSGRLHADQLRIPLWFRGPGLAPRTESALVSIVDVMPTLLELTGTPVPPELDGRSLLANLRQGTALEPRPALAMEHYFAWTEGRRFTTKEVLDLPHLVARIDAQRWYIAGDGHDELYAPDDLEQRENLAPGGRARELRKALGERPRKRLETPAPESGVELDESLNALGYGGER